MYTIGQFSIMTKIPKKTLRYYDEIDLLKPAEVDMDNNYRYYDATSVLKAQQILIYRTCKVPLEHIKEIVHQEHDKKDLQHLLKSQLDRLQEKVNEIRQSQSVLKRIIHSLEENCQEVVKDCIHKKVNVLSIRREGNHSTIGEIIGKLFEMAVVKGFHVVGPHTIIWYTDKDFTEKSIDMEIYIPVEIPEQYNYESIKTISEKRYCEIIHHGSMTTLSSSYAKIYSFTQTNGLKICGPFEETYLSSKKFLDPYNMEIVVAAQVERSVL